MGTEGPAAGDKKAVSMKCGGSSLGSITVLALGLAGVLAACGGGGVAKGRTVVPDLFCLTPIQARAALRQDGLVGIAHLTVGAPPPIGRDMVYSQSPPGGRDVATGTAVTYYATTGTRRQTAAQCRASYKTAPGSSVAGSRSGGSIFLALL